MDGCPDGDGDEPEPEEDVDLFVDDVVGQDAQPILVLNRAGGTVLEKRAEKNMLPTSIPFQNVCNFKLYPKSRITSPG